MIEYNMLRNGDILKRDSADSYTIIHNIGGEWRHTMTHWKRRGHHGRTINPKDFLVNKHTEVVGNIYDALGKAIGEDR